MSSWWNETIDGLGITAEEYLRNNWEDISDRQIAENLEELTGQSVSKQAVRSKRRRIDLTYAPGEEPDTLEDGETRFVQRNNNIAYAITADNAIKTEEQLIEACNVDLERWTRTRAIFNTWTTTMKGPDKMPLQVHNWQIKVYFRAKEPELEFPVVQPINPDFVYSDIKKPQPLDGNILSMVISDPHFGFLKNVKNAKLKPFHDREALSIAVQAAKEKQPDRIDVVGDLLDLPEWGTYTKKPEFIQTTMPSLLEAHYWLLALRNACPEARIILHKGNHEDRVQRAIYDHFEAASGIKRVDMLDGYDAFSIPFLLALDKIGVEWAEDEKDSAGWMAEDINGRHGDTARKNPGASARALLDEGSESKVAGHNHRVEMVHDTQWGRNSYTPKFAATFGCMCHLDGRVPGTKLRQNWQKGFGFMEYNTNLRQQGIKYHTLQFVLIHRGQAVIDGKTYQGKSHIEEIAQLDPEYNW